MAVKMGLDVYEEQVCLTCRQWFKSLVRTAAEPDLWQVCGDCIVKEGREAREMVHQALMWTVVT